MHEGPRGVHEPHQRLPAGERQECDRLAPVKAHARPLCQWVPRRLLEVHGQCCGFNVRGKAGLTASLPVRIGTVNDYPRTAVVRVVRRSRRKEPCSPSKLNEPSRSARCTTCHGGCPPSLGSGKTSWTASTPPGRRGRANAAEESGRA